MPDTAKANETEDTIEETGAVVTGELLVEEVSIDGMCGVY